MQTRTTNRITISAWTLMIGFALVIMVSAGCSSPPTQPPTGTPAARPAEPPTATLAAPTASPTVTPLPTQATPTPNATATMVQPTKTSAPMPTAVPAVIGHEVIHSSITVEGYVQGVKVTSVWAIGESVYNRSFRPFDKWELNNAVIDTQYGPPGTAAARVSEVVMRMHYLGWRQDAGLEPAKSPEDLNNGYAAYLKDPKPYFIYANGEGNGEMNSRKVDPSKTVRLVVSNDIQVVQLDGSHKGLSSVTFVVGEDGSLDVVHYVKAEGLYNLSGAEAKNAPGLSTATVNSFMLSFLLFAMPEKYSTSFQDAARRDIEQALQMQTELDFLRAAGVWQTGQRPAILIKEK